MSRLPRTFRSAQFAAVVRAFLCPQFFGQRFFRVGFATTAMASTRKLSFGGSEDRGRLAEPPNGTGQRPMLPSRIQRCRRLPFDESNHNRLSVSLVLLQPIEHKL